MASRAKGAAAACALTAVTLLAGGVSAEPVPEYELKAAFVYNFALFTEWPSNTSFEGNSLNLCVNSANPLQEALAGLTSKRVKGRKIVIRQLGAEGMQSCHILFAGINDRRQWSQIRKSLADASVLTITDDEEIGREGSVISLSMQGQRIVFDVDLREATRARLVLSSKLLRLARSVQ